MLDFSGLELNTSEPVYLQIVGYVKRQIFTGAAEQGNPLPSRRELAAMLKINPNTVQKAVRLMEEEGFEAAEYDAADSEESAYGEAEYGAEDVDAGEYGEDSYGVVDSDESGYEETGDGDAQEEE